jgi:hypothetical protein
VEARDLIERTPLPAANRRLIPVIPLILLLVLFLWSIAGTVATSVGPSGRHYGIDYAAYLAAARITKDGDNPYDAHLLYDTEWQILRRQRLPITANRPIVRVGSPMLSYWAFEPFLRLPFQRGAYVWMIGMYVLAGIGFLASLRYAGWDRPLLPLLILLAMPQALIGTYFEGNNVGLVCAALGLALALQARFPLLAGLILTFAWLKPQVALPLVLLVLLFHARRPAPAWLGFGAGTAAFLALSILTDGVRSLRLWVGGLFGYSGGLRAQVDIASLVSLYDRWAPSGPRLAIEVALVALALVLTVIVWWRVRTEQRVPWVEISLLWFAWFLASPSAHFYDEILLVAPILLLLGRNGWRLSSPYSIAGIYLLFLSFFVTSWYPLHVSPSSLTVAAAGALLGVGALRAPAAEPSERPVSATA